MLFLLILPLSGFHPCALSSNSCPSRVIKAQPKFRFGDMSDEA